MFETSKAQFRKSGRLPDPAELSGSYSTVFTRAAVLTSLGSHAYYRILSTNMIILGYWNSAVSNSSLHYISLTAPYLSIAF